MAITGNQTKQHMALRKRIRKSVRVPFIAKQFAWRLTAGWFWICALGASFGFSGNLSKWEDALLLALNGTLAEFGFTPSNPRIFGSCVKLLWLFAFADSLARFSFRRLPSSLFWLPHMCHYRTLC